MAKKKKRSSGKFKLFSVKSLLTTVKAIAVSVVVGVPTVIFRLIALKWLTIGLGLGALYMLFALFLWGFLANKFWGWK